MKEPILEIATPQFTHPSLVRFSEDESGQDIVEYALLAAMVALGSVASTQNLALTVVNTFTSVQNTLTNSIPSASPGSGGGSTGGSSGGGGNSGGGGGGRRGGGGRGGSGGGPGGGGFGGGGFGAGHGGGARGGGGRGGHL